MTSHYRVFRAGSFTSWEGMCEEVTKFINEIGREDLIGLTQSEDKGSAVLIIWYWTG